MNADARRKEILNILEQADQPVSAAALAEHFSVSRQIIVGDVALLRAGGDQVSATPRGYVIRHRQQGLTCTIACRHDTEQMAAELYAIVDQGCTVMDVIVEHPIYGQLTGALQLRSRFDVEQYIERCRQYKALPLSLLTEGIHLHTLDCPDEAALDRVRKSLSGLHILLENN